MCTCSMQCKQTQTFIFLYPWMTLIVVNHELCWNHKNIDVKCGRWTGLDKAPQETQHTRETHICPSACPSVCLSFCLFVWMSGISIPARRKALPTSRTHHDHRKSRSAWQLCMRHVCALGRKTETEEVLYLHYPLVHHNLSFYPWWRGGTEVCPHCLDFSHLE